MTVGSAIHQLAWSIDGAMAIGGSQRSATKSCQFEMPANSAREVSGS